jgi:hypothetical protein
MRSRHLLSLSVVLAFGMSALGCDKDKKAKESDPELLLCEANEDCEEGWVCLAGECANAASGAIYTDPANAVTPDKVRGQIEKIQENSQKRADEILEGL